MTIKEWKGTFIPLTLHSEKTPLGQGWLSPLPLNSNHPMRTRGVQGQKLEQKQRERKRKALKQLVAEVEREESPKLTIDRWKLPGTERTGVRSDRW